MKIQSRTNVITNSSDEVFTLRTTKTPEEVYQWLKGNITWWFEGKHDSGYPFTEPEVMEKGKRVIDWLINFGDLYDSGNPDDVKKYKLRHCLNFASDHGPDYDYKIKKYGRIVKSQFETFCENNMRDLLECFKDYRYINTEDDFWDLYESEMEYDPEYIYPAGKYTDRANPFLEKFIEWYEKENKEFIPDWWSIPENQDVQYWKGKIGFCTNGENTIKYEDMEKICEEFDGEHWHMG